VKRLASLLVTLMLLTGCPSKTAEVPTETTAAAISTTTELSLQPEEWPDWSIPFTPDNDAFSFENFGGGEPPADLTVNMARRMYGDAQVCQTVVDNQCTPFPVILQLIAQANRSMQGGLCEGLAVLSLRLSGDINSIESFQQVSMVSQLVKEDPALLSELAFWYVTQFAPEVQERASVYRQMEPMDLARILQEDFEESTAGGQATGFTIGIYSDEGGHAVTPYRVETTSHGYRIYIYDSNWPTAERWIDVTEDGWVYALAALNPSEESSAWSGGAGTMELTPMTARKPPFDCPFCPTDGDTTKSGTLLTVASSGEKQANLQIETNRGERLGYYDGVFVNEIAGATFRYLISGPSTSDPVLVSLPATVESFTADVSTLDNSDLQDDGGEESDDRFSLLILDDERSLQVEAAMVEEEPKDVEEALISFSDESVEIGDVSEAMVSIAIDTLEAEIELDEGQELAVQFSEDDPEAEDEPETMDIGLLDESGEELATIEIDLTDYVLDELGDEEPPPVIFEIDYDEEAGEIVQEQDTIEAWVATDAEYFVAVSEGRLEEILGDTWLEEYEEEEEWIVEDSLTDVLLEIDDDYWEDEYWDEIDYDEEWFLEEEEEWDFSEDDPLASGVITTPILITTDTTERRIPIRTWITTNPIVTSSSTTNPMVFTDQAGTLTEMWTTTVWTTTTETMTHTETEVTMGLIQTWNTNGEITTEEIWGEPKMTTTTMTDITITMVEDTQLTASSRNCLWRENQTGTMIGLRTGTIQNMTMVPMSIMMPTIADKPSGCATPGTAVVTQRQDGITNTTNTVTTTAKAEDGYWYDTVVQTDTATVTYTDVSVVTWSDDFVETTYSDPYDVATDTVTTSVVANDCALTGGWTAMGDSCIADIETWNQGDIINFTLAEAAMVTITGATELTCSGWPGTSANGEEDYGDPYIYLYDSNGTLVEKDDDDGCSCGNNCGDDGNCWDSLITRQLSAGTYALHAKTYNQNTQGWFTLTISSE
jgi:hypothetical protein